MILIMVGILIGAVVGAKVFTCERFLFAFLISLLLGAFGAVGADIWGETLPSEIIETNPVHLAALRDNTSWGGSFFLGSGTIDKSLVYYYYERLPNGGYKAGQSDVETSVIFEDDPPEPYYADIQRVVTIDDWRKWFVLSPSVMPQRNFHIPSGSILRNYSLDLN